MKPTLRSPTLLTQSRLDILPKRTAQLPKLTFVPAWTDLRWAMLLLKLRDKPDNPLAKGRVTRSAEKVIALLAARKNVLAGPLSYLRLGDRHDVISVLSSIPTVEAGRGLPMELQPTLVAAENLPVSRHLKPHSAGLASAVGNISHSFLLIKNAFYRFKTHGWVTPRRCVSTSL